MKKTGVILLSFILFYGFNSFLKYKQNNINNEIFFNETQTDYIGVGVLENQSPETASTTNSYDYVKKESTDLIKDNLYKVSRVVDGDTIEVFGKEGIREKVRLIGVDTPEIVDPRQKVECFGKESSEFLKNLILDKDVGLEYDKSQGDKDRYGRILRYIYLGNILVNKKIIEDGYGHEYTYRLPYKFQKEFKNAQNLAMESKVGLWGEACND